jgi:hypothetical protein
VARPSSTSDPHTPRRTLDRPHRVAGIELGLTILDIVLEWFHIVSLLFNLFGWLIKPLRRVHFGVILATAFSWFVLGYWYGWGYCICTDWHWRIKHALGQQHLPASYITYLLEKYLDWEPSLFVVSNATLAGFILALTASVYFNFFPKNK